MYEGIKKLIILSDIHSNLSALQAVINDFKSRYNPDAIALLGDLINYGMRPNEVISEIKSLANVIPIICNLRGNHENALIDGDLSFFSTERGKEILNYTSRILTESSLSYLKHEVDDAGLKEVIISKKSVLFIHGDLNDSFWGNLTVDKINDGRYKKFDYVISGHTHRPHFLEKFFSCENDSMRNLKKTVFLNPGSVGQPRNHNPFAQYIYIDFMLGTIHYNAVPYNIEFEKSLFSNEVNSFYKDRLTFGN